MYEISGVYSSDCFISFVLAGEKSFFQYIFMRFEDENVDKNSGQSFAYTLVDV